MRWRAFEVLRALSFILLVSPAAAEEFAVRIGDDGRVDVRVTAAPLASVLDRLASETGMTVAYQGPRPLWTVSLDVSGANHAQAVMDILQGLGLDYVVTTDPAGTRVRSLVVAESARSDARSRRDPAQSSPAPSAEPEATLTTPADVAEAADAADAAEAALETHDPAASSTPAGEVFTPLPGDFIPGGRATGQPVEWGRPAFVLPDPLEDAGMTPDSGSPPPPASR